MTVGLVMLLMPLSSPVPPGTPEAQVMTPVEVSDVLRGREAQPPPEPVQHVATCTASYYGAKFHGRTTANGETFDMHGLTAAHRTLEFGSRVRVTGPRGTVVVRVNDRGPWHYDRCIDLSKGAFGRVAPWGAGLADVTLEVLP